MSVLLEEQLDGVRILRLNRPQRRNALSSELVDALVAALDRAEADSEARVVVITGEGSVFCAGGDLGSSFQQEGGVVGAERGRLAFGQLLGRMPKMGTPVIAAVQGDCMGGGLGLASACDMIVADEGARLGTPEVKLGLFPMIIMASLRRSIPRKVLTEMMLTGGRLSAQRAYEVGLVNRVAPSGQTLDVAMELAGQVAARSMATVSLGKQAFYDIEELPYEAALRVLNGRLTVNLLLEDAMEGIAAFMERRKPNWKDR